jgi:hypothetical protein
MSRSGKGGRKRMRLDNEYADQFKGDNYFFGMILTHLRERFLRYFKRIGLKLRLPRSRLHYGQSLNMTLNDNKRTSASG